MKIRFWGVRGSIPTPMRPEQFKKKLRNLLLQAKPENIESAESIDQFLAEFPTLDATVIGGNTSCIEVQADGQILIFDMGSGLKALGNQLMREARGKDGLDIHIFMSHTHWDHMLGFPFFVPAFIPSNRLHFYSVHPKLRERMEIQQDFRFFPVGLDHMAAQKEFTQMQARQEVKIGNIRITNYPLYHPGGSYGYRVEHDGKVFVYATDSEYKDLNFDAMRGPEQFFRNADMIIFDAQYTFEEANHKEDWGHSSALIGIDMAVRAGVKTLVLHHHEPERDDDDIEDILHKSLQYKRLNHPDSDLEILLGREGLEFTL